MLFLLLNVILRKIDPPYLTATLNTLDYNAALSLYIIFSSLYFGTVFENVVFGFIVLIVMGITNFQFLIIIFQIIMRLTIYQICERKSFYKYRKYAGFFLNCLIFYFLLINNLIF